jgi:lipoprotein LprA
LTTQNCQLDEAGIRAALAAANTKEKSMKYGVRAVVAATVAVGFALTGCSSNNSSSTSSADAATLVKQSADAMKQVTGFHFELDAQGKIPNLKVSKVVGDVSNTPALVATGTATVSMGQQTQDAKLVYVGGHMYSDIADPGGKFTDYGDGNSIYNATVLIDPQRGLATLLADLKDPKVDGDEDVNGVKATKISGTSSSNDILVLAGSRKPPQKEVTLPTTVWIADDGSHHLVKAELKPTPQATVDLTLSDYNKQVTATKPV